MTGMCIMLQLSECLMTKNIGILASGMEVVEEDKDLLENGKAWLNGVYARRAKIWPEGFSNEDHARNSK